MLLDVTPRQFLALAGDEAPARYRRALERYRYGPGVLKVDYALSGPVPWAASRVCARRHRAPRRHARRDRRGRGRRLRGTHPERPYVLVAQQSLFDPTRAPEGSTRCGPTPTSRTARR